MEPPARVAAFKTEMNAHFPGFYDVARFRNMTPERYDELVSTSFENFPAIRERYVAAARNFEAAMAPARASFAATFPDVAPVGNIYLVHSLGEMDGGQRTINGQARLIFGADVMARVHTFNNETPFFHHELFHMYHRQFFESCSELWCGLWREGLATYVANELTPGASDDQLLLTSPRPIRPEIDANLARVVCATIPRVQLTDQNQYYFSGGRTLDDFPPRFGYYVGLLAAREAGKMRTLQELAHLSVDEARPIVLEALRSLAPCPAAN
jgi:hypothetical protein